MNICVLHENSRSQSLDVLRGVAVLMVVICHCSLVLNYDSVLLGVGNCGVDLFFVLSGFLISGLLFNEFTGSGTIDVKRFWIRRGFKIYPPFYALIVVTASGFLVLSRRLPRELLGDVFFLQNYAPHVWMHGWSLAVEEHFYFLLPLLLLAMLRARKSQSNPFRLIPAISVAISVLCLYLRIVAFHRGADWTQIAFPTHLRIDALFAGVTLGYYAHFDRQSFREAGKTWVLLIGLAFSATLVIMPSVPRLTFAYVAFAFIVAWAANRGPSRSAFTRALAGIGYYSYSIYLWHVIAFFELERLPQRWFRFPVYVLSSIILGIVMAKLIEVPALRVRDRWFPKRLVSEAPPSIVEEPAIRLGQLAKTSVVS